MLKNSKIYVGKVIHRRFKPKNHYFKYRVFSLLIDLDDLNEIDNKIKIFSYNKFNIISFFDKDHGDRDGTSLKNSCVKKFHVSPFIDMECNYKFRVNKPSDKISVIIDQSDNDGKLLFASQDGTAKEFSNKNLFVSYIFHPLMTFKVIVAIHYEAFKLWLKGIKFIKKKINIKNNSSVEKSEFE